MPVYEYACRRCAHEFEEMSAMRQRDKRRTCPQCGATDVERKISVFSARQAEAPADLPPGGCNRCGGPGPCMMDN